MLFKWLFQLTRLSVHPSVGVCVCVQNITPIPQSHHKISLVNCSWYVLRVKKVHFGSLSDPWNHWSSRKLSYIHRNFKLDFSSHSKCQSQAVGCVRTPRQGWRNRGCTGCMCTPSFFGGENQYIISNVPSIWILCYCAPPVFSTLRQPCPCKIEAKDSQRTECSFCVFSLKGPDIEN